MSTPTIELAETTADEARRELLRELLAEVRTGWPEPVRLDGGPDTPEAVARRRADLLR